MKAISNRPRLTRVTRGAGLGMIDKPDSVSLGSMGQPFHEGEALGAGIHGDIASRPFPKSPFSGGNPAKKTRSYIGP